jgi:uncharacterized membrane protein YdjX (TVP38/TMEM64 family)
VTPEPPSAPARLPWAKVARFALFLALVLGAAAAFRFTPLGQYLDQERLLALFEELRSAWWTPLALLGLYLLLTPLGLPVSPLMFAGGIVFGVVWGGALNVVGTLSGAFLSYWLARALGRDLVHHLVGDRLTRVEKTLSRKGFWPMVRVRFLPIPFPVINYGAALAGVPFPLFALTSILGLVPSVTVYTYFFATLFRAAQGDRRGVILQLVVALVGILLLSFLPTVVRGRKRRQRYRELTEARRRRR